MKNLFNHIKKAQVALFFTGLCYASVASAQSPVINSMINLQCPLMDFYPANELSPTQAGQNGTMLNEIPAIFSGTIGEPGAISIPIPEDSSALVPIGTEISKLCPDAFISSRVKCASLAVNGCYGRNRRYVVSPASSEFVPGYPDYFYVGGVNSYLAVKVSVTVGTAKMNNTTVENIAQYKGEIQLSQSNAGQALEILNYNSSFIQSQHPRAITIKAPLTIKYQFAFIPKNFNHNATHVINNNIFRFITTKWSDRQGVFPTYAQANTRTIPPAFSTCTIVNGTQTLNSSISAHKTALDAGESIYAGNVDIMALCNKNVQLKVKLFDANNGPQDIPKNYLNAFYVDDGMKLSQYGFVVQNKDKPGQDLTIYPLSASINPDSTGAIEFPRATLEGQMIPVGFNFFYKKVNSTGSANTGKIQSKVLIRYTYE